MLRPFSLALFALVLLAACADQGPLPPQLSSVTPISAPENQPATFTVTGDHLALRMSADFTSGSGQPVAAESLALRSGSLTIPLTITSHPSATQLVGTLASGVARGAYDLVYTDGWGRQAVLAGAVHLLGPCESLDGTNPGDACDGPDSDLCLDDTWICQNGTLVCSNGADNPDVCDGLDNDCNPATADGSGEPTLGLPCDGPDTDLCTDDVFVCNGFAGMACSTGADNPDVCDGLDNDCNPSTADGSGEATLGQSCDGPDSDICTDDTVVCNGAAGLACSTGTNNVDVCDGIDNDCDPSTSDGSGDPALGQFCDGPDTDLCTDDVMQCNGALGMQCSTGANNPDLCDGVDNDCNPATADGSTEPTLGQQCDGPDSDLCTDDSVVCNGAAGLACSTGANNPDVCDGIDNDCNPSTADGSGDPSLNAPCDGPDTDLCNDDVQQCVSGGLVCSTGANNVELCDGLDNDCNPSTLDGAAEPTLNQACDGPDTDSCKEGSIVCNGGSGLACSDATDNTCGISMKVGTFIGSQGSTTQTVAHGLGTVPKAIIFFSVGGTQTTPQTSQRLMMGLVDASRAQKVHASTSENGFTASDTSRRYANAAVSIITAGQALAAEAAVSAWDATNFTLNWSAVDAGNARRYHFLAIGGGPSNSKLINWQMAQTTGVHTVNGFGFSPKGLLHVHSGGQLTAAPPSTIGGSIFDISAGDPGGRQWTSNFVCADGVTVTQTHRAQRTDLSVFIYDINGNLFTQSSLSGIGSDGFSLNYSNASSGAGQVETLGFDGLRTKAFCFTKQAAMGLQTVNGIGFPPQAVLLASFQQGASNAVNAHGTLGISAFDATTSAAVATVDINNVSTTQVNRVDRTSAYVEVQASNTISSEASLSSLDLDGFTLNWTVNDGSATQICGLALGAP